MHTTDRPDDTKAECVLILAGTATVTLAAAVYFCVQGLMAVGLLR